jgi:hypothetical protein
MMEGGLRSFRSDGSGTLFVQFASTGEPLALFLDTPSHLAAVSAFWLYGRDVLNDKYSLDFRPSKLVTVEDEIKSALCVA